MKPLSLNKNAPTNPNPQSKGNRSVANVTPKDSLAKKSPPKPAAQPAQTSQPAYVVAVTAREPTEAERSSQKTYSPQELKAKAKAALELPSMPQEQKAILAEILDKEDATKDELK